MDGNIRMNSLYTELQWLPRAPQDFSASLKELNVAEDSAGTLVRSLALHALDLNQMVKLARVIERLRSNRKSLRPLVPFKLAVLSNSTWDLIVPALISSAARHGIDLEVVQPAYDQIAQEALTPDSKINASKPDGVLLALDYRALPLKLSIGDSAAAAEAVRGAIAYLESLRSGIKANSNSLCILQTFAPPPEGLFGGLDRAIPGTLRQLLNEINRQVAEAALGSGDVLLDIAGLAETVGLADWHDLQLWNMAKLPFADYLIPLYADYVARHVAAIRGKGGKVLVLDLDNTVWGGVIGDDGLDGIRVAEGDPRGESFRAVQRMALNLRERGIILAVASKNHDAVAREPFEKHPEMLLKLDHIAVFQANWDDKPSNIEAIARELSVGLDTIVFLDDNPVERGMVRQLLPQVYVPEVPEDPAWFARTLSAAGYFDAVTFAAEDLARAGFYRDNAKRANLQKQLGDVEAYLASLDMTITFEPFDSTGRARIVQLINKSNQYNLTTRRYTDPGVAEAQNDPEVFTLQVRLSDTFGDNGMISAVICRPRERAVWEIDTWLMSCRVLGRKVEYMVLREILEHARAHGIQKLIGVFKPTDRNKLVVDHYAKLGFTKAAENDGATQWEMMVGSVDLPAAPMKVISRGFAYSYAGN
jgi:FkbH-like protein